MAENEDWRPWHDQKIPPLESLWRYLHDNFEKLEGKKAPEAPKPAPQPAPAPVQAQPAAQPAAVKSDPSVDPRSGGAPTPAA